jgi:two-component system C4-dicarboxylate transport sensor histidine kinase DctB
VKFLNATVLLSNRVKTAAALLLALAVVLGAYLLGMNLARQATHEASARQLQLISLDVESILERYETLPYALSFLTEMAQATAQPQSPEAIAHVNSVLKSVQQQAKVASIYLMDASGKTIATSNWDEPQSYIGKNFGFRPYFKDAIAGSEGRFYGIGSTTAEPGYFIAQPVYATGQRKAAGGALGVIAVKISLNGFVRAWDRLEDPVALVDNWGVIFLSNRPAWQYHSVAPLSPEAQQAITGTLQYTGQKMEPVASLPDKLQTGFGVPQQQGVGRLGWQLMTFPDHVASTRIASRWALMAALLVALTGLSLWALHQRRRRLEERGQARLALQQAATDLEQKISARTAELTQANQSIAAKYGKLKEAQALLRDTQNELVQAGKLAMLGQMAAGMTHELNQPLTAIRAFSDNAKTFLERGQSDKTAENLGHISAASARMGAIIGQMKEFARKSDAPMAAVDLAQAVQSSLHLLQHDLSHSGCSVEVDVRSGVRVWGDRLRIEQVLINLLRNAIDAAEPSVNKRVHVALLQEDGVAVLRVRDSGSGLPQAVASRLFEPFFTTKPAGKGLGLGLAISSSIVQAMNGHLSAQNSADGGAEFELRLALFQDPTNL